MHIILIKDGFAPVDLRLAIFVAALCNKKNHHLVGLTKSVDQIK